MAGLQEIEWLEPLADRVRNRELERYVKAKDGLVPPHTRYFGDCPWILRADIDLDIGGAYIAGELFDLIYLVVSQDNSCRFCYAAARMFMSLAGMSEEQSRQLEQQIEAGQLDAKTEAALEFARRLSRSNPLPGAADMKVLVEAGYSEPAAKEVAFFASDVIFHNRFGTLLALPPQTAERIAGSRFNRLLRPLVKRLIARAHDPRQPVELDAALKAGPFSEVVNALDGLPSARVLRKIIDEAWASPHLGSRAKALIFAVVARGLGSVHAEREASRLLAAEGLEAPEVEEILAHLASPALDPIEAAILPYARETIRYKPVPIQKRGRELRAQLGNARFIETVGIAALANMVCRLAMILDES